MFEVVHTETNFSDGGNLFAIVVRLNDGQFWRTDLNAFGPYDSSYVSVPLVQQNDVEYAVTLPIIGTVDGVIRLYQTDGSYTPLIDTLVSETAFSYRADIDDFVTHGTNRDLLDRVVPLLNGTGAQQGATQVSIIQNAGNVPGYVAVQGPDGSWQIPLDVIPPV